MFTVKNSSGKPWFATSHERIYFARHRVGGKLIRQSLKTDVLSVAQLRLGDLVKAEREHLEARSKESQGKLSFDQAVEIYRQRVVDHPKL